MSFPEIEPYPDRVFDGASGLVNATVRPSASPPDLTYSNGGNVHYLATGKSTGGKFGVYHWEMSSQPSGPAPHFHRTMTESFYVPSGTIQLYNGTEWIDGTPGDFMHVPEGGIHGFRNESGKPATMLLMFSPGAPREHYFETLARVAEGLVLSDEDRAEFLTKHDNYFI